MSQYISEANKSYIYDYLNTCRCFGLTYAPAMSFINVLEPTSSPTWYEPFSNLMWNVQDGTGVMYETTYTYVYDHLNDGPTPPPPTPGPTGNFIKFTSLIETKVNWTTTVDTHTINFEYYDFNQNNWVDFPQGTDVTFGGGLEDFYLRGINYTLGTASNKYTNFQFTSDGSNEVSCVGDIMSLIDYEVMPQDVPEYCFYKLFSQADVLVSSPTLSAVGLGVYCYASMFYRCKKFNNAPALPATSLAIGCYSNMFQGCTNLIKAPSLPAPSLVKDCYSNMFRDCLYIDEVHCDATNITADGCTVDWLSSAGVGTGDFYGKSAANWTDGVNGIPSGWTKHLS